VSRRNALHVVKSGILRRTALAGREQERCLQERRLDHKEEVGSGSLETLKLKSKGFAAIDYLACAAINWRNRKKE